jgi:hypothetical protein
VLPRQPVNDSLDYGSEIISQFIAVQFFYLQLWIIHRLPLPLLEGHKRQNREDQGAHGCHRGDECAPDECVLAENAHPEADRGTEQGTQQAQEHLGLDWRMD